MRGGFDDDTLYGNEGNDTIYGAEAEIGIVDGDDRIDGGVGDDMLYGNAGDDTITGGSGADSAYGGFGDDFIDYSSASIGVVMWGGDGTDAITGGDGFDYINGGADDDVLTGGSGNDRFVYESLFQSWSGGSDRITDFSNVLLGLSNRDFIDLTALDFTGVQSGSASGTVLGYTTTSTDTIITDASGVFRLILTGVLTLTADDFVF